MEIIEALTVSEDGFISEAHDMEPAVVVVEDGTHQMAHAPMGNPDVLVVEEPLEVLETVPGSDMVMDLDSPEVVEEQKKTTNWADDKDFSKFLDHMEKELKSIPKHDGQTVLGCERAISFLKAKQSEIIKAIKEDLKGEVDEKAADKLYYKIEQDIEKLEKHKERIKKKASVDVNLFSEATCEKCNNNSPMWHNVADNKLVCMACESEEVPVDKITKQAGTPKLNVYVSAFERAIVGILINGSVSAGHNIEELYNRLKGKYNFNPREELAIQQLVEDHGYFVFKDRGLINEDSDPQSENGMDWSPNYYA